MYTTHKRLLVFCDGTAQDGLICSDGLSIGGQAPLYFTNVLRLSRAVKQFATTPGGRVLQIVYYQAGVGSESDFKGHASSADLCLELYGTAVARKIRDAYAFIAQNWMEGDEIILCGFSRGAYTARKVAGLIARIGILDIKEMGKFYPYCYALETGKGDLPARPVKPVPIQLVAVWDTVGSLRSSLVQAYPGDVNQLNIPDSDLYSNVRVALHGMSLHENRNWFQPTLFTVPDKAKQSDEEKAARQGQILKQVWFGGEHSDVGGGWDSHELADIALFWMASEASPYIALDEEMLLQTIRPSPSKPRWGESIPHNSYEGTAESVALVGHIEPKTRLDGGQITPDAVFHPSLLLSPRPTEDEIAEVANEYKKRDEISAKGQDPGPEPLKNEGGKEKAAAQNIVKALGKHMITLDDLRKKFGEDWEPTLVQLNPLEEKARQRWLDPDPATDHHATYESREQWARVVNESPANAAKVHTD